MAVDDVRFVASSRLPTRWGLFTAYGFVDSAGKEHLVLAMGNVSSGEPILARIHSECLTGDALFSLRCDCGFQLRTALKIIGKEKRGVLLYLRQEGRGIGLHNKIKAYDLQDKGADTVDANVHLGFEADARSYDICKPMLDHIGVYRLRLLTNNPSKVTAMRENDGGGKIFKHRWQARVRVEAFKYPQKKLYRRGRSFHGTWSRGRQDRMRYQ